MTTITCGPPVRDVPGFGCPACARLIPFEKLTGRDLSRGLACCGYLPTEREAARWARAGRLIRERES